MPILPIDLQAIIVRMDDMSKIQQNQQDGIALAQLAKGVELGDLAQIESSRVNEVKPHPDENNKVEDKGKGSSQKGLLKKKEKTRKKVKKLQKEFEDPEKGVHIDVVR